MAEKWKFDHLRALKSQFGNMIAIDESRNTGFLGSAGVFLSSIVQFQPLAEIELLNEDMSPVSLTCSNEEITPLSVCKDFKNETVTIREHQVLYDDLLKIDLSYGRKGYGKSGKQDNSSVRKLLRISGACLFSPQGVPYHWDQRKQITGQIVDRHTISIKWQDSFEIKIFSTEAFGNAYLNRISDEEVGKKEYFSSFNLKKRYNYWVENKYRTGDYGKGQKKVKARNILYCITIPLIFNEGEPAHLEFGMTFKIIDVKDNNLHFNDSDVKSLESKKKESLNALFDRVPSFKSDNKQLERIYYTSWYILSAGKTNFGGSRLPYPFTSVNKFHYYNQFFWDSAYHALSWLWLNDSGPAEDEMKNFITSQYNSGMIPYELFLFPANGREWMESDGNSTTATQPPVIAITWMEIYKKFHNKEYLKFFYEPLLRYENWLWLYRDLKKRGLSSVTNIWETGCDNSPRLDHIAKNRVLDPFLEEVDFNVLIYLLRGSLIYAAGELGLDAPSYIKDHMDLTRQSMNTLMYDQADAFYYDLHSGSTEKVKVKTHAGLFPLLTDIPGEKREKELVNRYLLAEDEFLTACPVPTVSIKEPVYSSNDFWRGANWPQITWTIIYGLKKHHPEAASEILDRFLSTTIANDNCYEYYDSQTGEGAGLSYQGWGTLYIDMILRHVAGIEPEVYGFRFSPLSTRFDRFSVENLILNNTVISIYRTGNRFRIRFDSKFKLDLTSAAAFSCKIEPGKISVILDNKDNIKDVAAESIDSEIIINPESGSILCIL
ncbi:MAG: glycogen debranching protein [Spirochaetes bacterium]|nr:glycogen debranching protein [Spirochaetota bacterium]